MKRLVGEVAFLALIVGTAAGATETAGWSLATCDSTETTAAQAAGESLIRRAAPGDELWVPHPYSTVGAEIVENVLTRHRQAFSDLAEPNLPVEDARLFRLWRDGGLRTELARVADWTPLRCERSERRDAYWLIRFFDATSGKEISRVLARTSGLVSRIRHATLQYAFPPLPSLKVPQAFASEFADAAPSSAQYVSTWGPDQCDAITPCVAWRTTAGVVVLKDNRALIVGGTSERLSFSGDLSHLRVGEVADRVHSQGRELVSLGGDLFAAAEVLTKQTPTMPSP